MHTLKIKNYYKALNGGPEESGRALYVKFRDLVKRQHSDFDDNYNHEQFLLITEAYYLLTFEEWKKLYDKQYRRTILYDPDVCLEEKEENELEIAIKKAQEFAKAHSRMPFKEYWKNMPKKTSLLQDVFNFIADLFLS